MKDKLPKFTPAQMVGNRAASVLQAVMQKFCIFEEISANQDLGIDFMGTILENSLPTKYNFNVQCKGTEDSGVKMNADKSKFVYSIKTTTINYWKQKKDVTFLFLVDIKKEVIFWSSPLKEIDNRDLSKQDSVTIHIPLNNIISSKSICLSSDFKFEIIRYYACFAQGVVSQLQNIRQMKDNNEISHMLELVKVLEANMLLVQNEYNELISELRNKITEDLNSTYSYWCILNTIDIVKKYCPKGIFDASFSNKKGGKTLGECEIKLESYVNNNTISHEKLYELSKEVFEIRKNVLAFLREMAYEDCPYMNHTDIDEECTRILDF